ncbi:MAG: hypothetical protein J07HX64_01534 [halophilic archaeon J07HX64]|nr:MAG: hypothetical protein J07HX64_01534 [halophilic archaeon J07HX64]
MTAQSQTGERVVVAKRVESGEADTTEIEELTGAAGYRVVETATQTRTEDPGYGFGEGKVEEIATLAAAADATVLVIDNALGPYQTFNVGNKLPESVRVVDRFRLILEIFGQRAQNPEGTAPGRTRGATLRTPAGGGKGESGKARRASRVHGPGRVRPEP